MHLDGKMEIGEKIIKFLNFGQVHFEPPECENRKVPLTKEGASRPPQCPPPQIKKITTTKKAERKYNILKILVKYILSL